MISQIILVVERLMTIFARMNVGLGMLDGHVPIHTTGKIRHHVAELALKYFSAFIVNSFANVFIGRRLVIPTKTWIASLSLSMISRIRIGSHMFNIWNKSWMIQKHVTFWQSFIHHDHIRYVIAAVEISKQNLALVIGEILRFLHKTFFVITKMLMNNSVVPF